MIDGPDGEPGDTSPIGADRRLAWMLGLLGALELIVARQLAQIESRTAALEGRQDEQDRVIRNAVSSVIELFEERFGPAGGSASETRSDPDRPRKPGA